MLAFLAHARGDQPSRRTLEDFFCGRRFSKDPVRAVEKTMEVERADACQGVHGDFSAREL